MKKEFWPITGDTREVHFVLQKYYSGLEKEVWPFSWESEVPCLPLTQQLNPTLLTFIFYL